MPKLQELAQHQPALVIGLMSGTSVDGLDICAVSLQRHTDAHWTHEVVAVAAVPYTKEWENALHGAFAKTQPELASLDAAYGQWLGEQVKWFCESRNLHPVLVASHGHTVHHRPEEGYTLQIGSPKELHDACGTPVVADFRSADVAAGGQGAPLVPVADELLFGEYATCLNLGGFANVSYRAQRQGEHLQRIAFDITAVGVLLNRLAGLAGHTYDDGGALARLGSIDAALLKQLDALAFYQQPAPKSLGREWFEQEVWPTVHSASLSPTDALATCAAHIVGQLAASLSAGPAGQVLVTGGGAHNTFLIEQLRGALPKTHELVLPKGHLIDYKEAIAFALLGALRVRGETNALASVTGAQTDTCGGVVVGL